MILLQANQVSRRFADTALYENVSFSIQTNDRIALVGRNGTGKSTLIKQIIGEEPISSGTISKGKGVKIGYLEQHVAIDSNRTIWDEMLHTFEETLALRERAQKAADRLADLADQHDSSDYQTALADYDHLLETLNQKNAYAIESEIRTVLHGFRFYEEDYQTPVQSLSGGQKTRLALAQILLKDYDLLILDEPTNHLDMQMLAWLENYLTSYKGALLIVSHDRYFLDRVANQVIELRHKSLHTYKGNYSYYINEKEQRLLLEQKAFDKQQETIAKLEDFVQKNIVRASTTKRAQSRRKQLDKMVRLDKPKQDAKAPRIQFSAAKESGERVIETDKLAIGYPVSTDRKGGTIARHINLDLHRQEAIAIVGPNGIGKTTLLKTVLGQLPAHEGSFKIGSNVQIGYYDQNVNQLNPDITVLETLWRAHDNTDERVIRTILGSFLFSGETVDKKVSMLSGGEKARLSLALLATDHDNTLLLDEPTNHLDIDSKEILEEALIEFDGTLLFVSHDRYFINRLATQVLELSEEGSTLYLGDYDYYVAKKAEQEEIQALLNQNQETDEVTATSAGAAQLSYEESKVLKRDLRKMQTAVDQAVAATETIEARIDQLYNEMAQASSDNDQSSLARLHVELMKTEEEQMQILEDWETSATQLEEFLEQYPHLKA